MIELGSLVKNRINGTVGMATGRAEYITGCNQVLVTAHKANKDGTVRDGVWTDEGLLIVTKEPDAKLLGAIRGEKQEAIGGPQHTPPRRF